MFERKITESVFLNSSLQCVAILEWREDGKGVSRSREDAERRRRGREERRGCSPVKIGPSPIGAYLKRRSCRSFGKTQSNNAAEGEIYVLPMLRRKGYNPRTHMARIVTKACGSLWPKLFQNLRSSRQTELQQSFPMHVVTSWLGNTQRVAEQYYLQVTDEHFSKAVEPELLPEAKGEAVDAETKQNPKQPASAPKGSDKRKARTMAGYVFQAFLTPDNLALPQGLEPWT